MLKSSLGMAAALLLAMLAPGIAGAQAPKAGIVTNLEGNVTATRAAGQPVPLKFKDDVFVRDRIITGERSLARMLLGGKAVVTVRERSILTITEEPGRSTIEIESGKFALAVAHERMRPGEAVEIRTPNAVAAVRGTVVITEVERAPTAQVGSVAAPIVSNLYVLRGSIEAQRVDPITRNRVGPSQIVNVLERFNVTGLNAGAVTQVRADQLQQIRAGLQPSTQSHTGAANHDQLTVQAMQTAVTLLNTLNGTGTTQVALATTPVTTTVKTTATTTSTPTTTTTSSTTTTVVIPKVTQALESAIAAAVADDHPVTSPDTTSTSDDTSTSTDTSSSDSGSGGSGGSSGTDSSSKTSSDSSGSDASGKTTSLVNGNFETGNFSGWTLSGAGSVIGKFGNLGPKDGKFQALLHTKTGVTLSGCGSGADCTRSTLSQSFTVGSIITLKGGGWLLSNEHPSFTSSSSRFNDRFLVQLIDALGRTFSIFDQRVNDTDFQSNSSRVTLGGFTLERGAGQASFDLGRRTLVPANGTATLQISVSNVSDTNEDSAILIDGLVLEQDPPLHFIRDGARFAAADTLLSLDSGAMTFDSLLTVCCDGAATLAGPALRATNASLDVPFTLISAIQGGSIVSTWPGPMVQLQGGSYTLGAIVGVFDVGGVNEGTDAGTGLTVGTDQPLRHGSTFLEADSAAITTASVMRVDTALLEASAPLLNLRNSTIVTTDHALDLSIKAKVTALGPLFALDASQMAVANGALVNVGRGSVLNVNGDLMRLANGSSLTLQNGPVANVTGNSLLSVSGSLFSFAGSGNSVSINNALCSSFSCTTIGGLNVALGGGATAGNVSITNAVKGAGGTVTTAPGAAALLVTGANSRVNVSGN